MRDIIRLVICFLVGLLPISCSKGGDGPSPSSGRFIDPPVAGLHYRTLTHSGETNRNGEFLYRPGEIVRFSVGDVIIGEATGSAILSPFDLAGIVPPQTSGDIRRAANLASRSKQATSLEIVANIAILLQSLDEDGDPSNGITIPDAMHSLARGVSLDFKQKSYTFRSSFALRSLMAKGRATGLWGGTRPIRKPGQALDTLYAGLGLTPAIALVTIVDQDDNADGTIDLRETYTYDADGNLILHEQDNKADGTLESRTTYTYDANGNLTLAESDHGDGIVYDREILGYDDNGNPILFERDFNGDGTVNSRDTLTYDINGSLTLWEHFSDGIDGLGSFRRSFSYDSNGNQTLIEDSNADGIIDWRTINIYGPNSKLIRTDGDTNADGIIDFRVTYTYDSQDHLILIEQDDQLDGTVNSLQRLTYDANGNQISIEYDSDANGTIDSRMLFAYDTNGIQTLIEFDHNGDGIAESRETDTYDINSNLTQLELDANGGTLDLRESLVYDADGNQILEEQDFNADGTVDLRRTFTNSPINRWSVLF